MAIASPVPTPALTTTTSRPGFFSSPTQCSLPGASKFVVPSRHLPLHPVGFSPWSGLKHMGISPNPKPLRFDGSPGPAKAYSSEELLKITEEQLSAATTAKQQTSSPQDGFATSASPPAETE